MEDSREEFHAKGGQLFLSPSFRTLK